MNNYKVRSDGTMDDEYHEPTDIRKFCRGLEEAWKLTPELRFHEIMLSVFDGYNPDELTGEEMEQMINDYILQNS